nr:unnamed protein product [Digitaria exilis]
MSLGSGDLEGPRWSTRARVQLPLDPRKDQVLSLELDLEGDRLIRWVFMGFTEPIVCTPAARGRIYRLAVGAQHAAPHALPHPTQQRVSACLSFPFCRAHERFSFLLPSAHPPDGVRSSPTETIRLHSWHLKRDNRITRQAEHYLPLPGYPYALTLSPIGGEKHIPKQWPTILKNTALSMTKITAIPTGSEPVETQPTTSKPPSKNDTLLVSRTSAPRKCESIPPELPIGGSSSSPSQVASYTWLQGAISPRAHEVTQKSSHPDIRSGCYYPHRRVVVLLGEVVLLSQCSSGGGS